MGSNVATRCRLSIVSYLFSLLVYYTGDELKRIVSIVVDVASCLDPDGVDIYFLNRKSLHNIQSSKQLQKAFANFPEGNLFIIFVYSKESAYEYTLESVSISSRSHNNFRKESQISMTFST